MHEVAEFGPHMHSEMPQPETHSGGRLFWITGLSGAGKTTVAMQLHERLIELGRETILLDGDEVRALFGSDLGHEPADRQTSAWRNARMCAALAEAGFDVVCATISMFAAVRGWLRERVPGYCEVYLRVPLEERAERDPKGLYARSRESGAGMVGLEQRCEFPSSPDLLIDNHGETTPARAVEQILARAPHTTRDPVPSATS